MDTTGQLPIPKAPRLGRAAPPIRPSQHQGLIPAGDTQCSEDAPRHFYSAPGLMLNMYFAPAHFSNLSSEVLCLQSPAEKASAYNYFQVTQVSMRFVYKSR